MGKGNWERRAERSSLEREAARERKLLQKKKLKCPNIEIILQQLYEGEKYNTVETSNIKVWVEDVTTSEWNLCRSWLRTGDCMNKRCPYLHDITLYGIRNVLLPPIENEEHHHHHNHNHNQHVENVEPSVYLSTLNTLRPEIYSLVRFVSVDDICVYDWALPNVWLEWSQARTNELLSRKHLKSIAEESNSREQVDSHDINIKINHTSNLKTSTSKDEEEEVDSTNFCEVNLDIISSIHISNEVLSSSSLCPSLSSTPSPLSHLPSSILSILYQFCSLRDIVSLSLSSKDIYSSIRKDTKIRLRKKEYLNSQSKYLNKQKKDEKKKKSKNSHVKKQDKKDGFARGGNC